MRVILKQRYIERINGRMIVYEPGDVVDIPHGQLLVDRGKAIPDTSAKPATTQLEEPPAGRRGRPKGK